MTETELTPATAAARRLLVHPGRGLITGRSFADFRRSAGGGLTGTFHEPEDCPVGGINLGRVPLCPPASVALSPSELEARIALYAERAAARVPVCTGGKPDATPEPSRAAPVRCWACGAVTFSRKTLEHHGWVCRPAEIRGHNDRMVEVYCGHCFAEWGWPDEPPPGG